MGGHAYSLISVHEKEGEVPRLMRMRNPWGKTEWNGAYSDSSSLWTEDLKEKLGHSDEDDGEFFMPFSEYLKYFDHTCIAMKVKNDYKIKNKIYDGVNHQQNTEQVKYDLTFDEDISDCTKTPISIEVI